MSMYLKYYDNQVGGGVTHQRQYITYNQRGNGVGGFLKGLYRTVYPILQRVARPVGEELWQAGVSVLDDVLTHKSDLKKSLETRLKESGHRLKRKAVDNLETLWNNRGGGSTSHKKKRRRKNIQKGSGINKQKGVMKKKHNQKGSGRPRVKKQKSRSRVQKGGGKKKKRNIKKNNKRKRSIKKKNKRNVYDIFS